MSHKCGNRRTWADELSVPAVEDSEPTPGLTMGDLMNPPSTSVDSQQSPEVLALEHPDKPSVQAYGFKPQLIGRSFRYSHQGSDSPRRVAVASGTATQGSHSPQGMDQGSELWQNLGDALSDPDHVSPDAGDMDEEENFTIPASEVSILCQEYTDFINLKDNAEIGLSEVMEATEQLNTVFNHIRTSMNRMSPRMKELFIVPSKKASGKTHEPRNNQAHDKAAANAATE
ncbi:hypothetical protein M422DRAFT_272788 [Sphaerobolus stellatus SS14]|uniref:Uncharacterized protein n=1 Tax=Sphaerobolus stellatus (strain SS14) TaxID=990650 RepID=A0A0C9UAP3_SPHS4|nr:hypothetical protein M422DRAFT_272788 [Sphaerobolus stellatus SS14]